MRTVIGLSSNGSEDEAAATKGGLMAYGPSQRELNMRVAIFVDKILNGAKLAELPVEQPTTYELIANMTTARALGLAFPPSLLAQVHHIVE